SRLKVLTLSDSLTFFEGKKFPLSIGIKETNKEVLLLTDADCKPVSNDWITHMVSQYDEAVVRNYSWKLTFHVHTTIVFVEMLKISELTTMKGNQDGNDF
ncbi:MAG: hypothetical protein JXR53_10150, partial [Bacteroidales bacterium]|nr:hypothetical protein [Bacteroidales bacterium]